MNVIKIYKLMLGVMVFSISSSIANAAYITGGMGITGNYDADATTLTLNSVSGTSGTDILGTTVGFGTPSDSINNGIFLYAPFASVVDVFQIGGWQLDLTTLVIDPLSTTEKLKLTGTGLLSGGGFDPTAATWTFSAQNASSYSMSITAVPVPAAAWLFGSGLLGLVGIARRRT